jgi:pyruvate, water dikinase
MGATVGLKDLAGRAMRRRARALPGLDERIACFREVLHANNTALGTIARMQEALAGEIELSAADLRSLLASATVQTFRMIINLNRMTGDAFARIVPTFERLKVAIQSRTEMPPTLAPVGFVLSLADIGASLAEQVGQKSANLGEAMRLLGGHVPSGFATTVSAYREFIESSGLAAEIRAIVGSLDAGDVAGAFRASAQLTQMVENAEVPATVATAIDQAVERLPGSPHLRMAVRSSALQEGGLEMSFAGQYRSLLNIPPRGVVDAFRRVVASKYSPQALTYRLSRGFTDDEVAMCCCVIAMIDASAAGVLYSAYQSNGATLTLLQAVRGLGLSAVDGSAEPDSYLIDRKARRVVASKLGHQDSLLQMAASEGTEKLALAAAATGRAILSEHQAVEVASLAWRLEAALGMPIDMEWAIGRSGEVFVLQVRPQPTHGDDARPRRQRQPGVPVLVDGGSRASGGAAAGVVCRVDSDLEILRCPPGAVIVTGEANPRLAVLLPQAAAIVADLGEITGHLATVARELRVPALFATRTATSTLPAGAAVTVDADAGVVYAGRIEEVLAPAAAAPALKPSPQRDRLASVADLIVPLTLRDRLASGYSPSKCKTLHDIIRFCHQATVEAMFALGDRALRRGDRLRRLVSEVPIDCRLLDLGGGLRPGVGPGDVTIDDVACVPMRALWRGMTDPRLHWTTARPVSLKGFMSAVVNYNFDQDQRMRSMGEPSYAFVSDTYLNLNSRIGYHFSTVDARIGEAVESNYASFRFVGGSTGVDQRSRRAILIQRLLDARGFETDCRADLVNARLRHRPAAVIEEAVFLVGLLMGYVNHLDMALTSDSLMRSYEEAFLAGDYAFKRREHHAQEA